MEGPDRLHVIRILEALQARPGILLSDPSHPRKMRYKLRPDPLDGIHGVQGVPGIQNPGACREAKLPEPDMQRASLI